ncbi:hypothetical protein [Nocardiopsis sp. NRRL B-16309]|uniref:hypothetical protein n=1 Tax=Nocardiopsis sp. NRRL B-16309 TaxID=1519494 RepID=UPI0006C24226|nr:hypothetical protein [Nocardiopsis sp. NRRL B-16309]KOX10135.1 hypothetical protein ADL05_25990 [Nocardiopsis sp. NRRL B-16309]
MKRFAALVVLVVVSGCSGGEPAVDAPASPSEAAAPSPEVEVDANSAQFICDDLRLWDAYRRADMPSEETDMFVLGGEILVAALEEDAEPALREIAREHSADQDAAAEAMIPWCEENTEATNPSSPW